MRRRILVVDDQDSIRFFLRKSLEAEGLEVDGAGSCEQARVRLQEAPPDVVLLDLKLPDGSGLELLAEIHRQEPDLAVVMMTAFGDVETSVKAMKLGAFDYVNKPIRFEELMEIIHRACSSTRVRARAHAGHEDLFARAEGIVPSVAPSMQEVYELVRRIGVSESSTVLIQGESGVGKDVIANLIHQSSPRRDHALLEINCASLPEALLESELFGHERGAFTDAISEKVGLLELANRGTLFLDEIGEMSLPVQVKLLRVLEKMSFRRVGGIKDITVDVRILAATNRDLKAEVATGRFREDLFYRLNVLPLTIPPLRERPEDIELLAAHFLREYSSRFGKNFERIDDEALRLMRDYAWPGNIRELKNCMERIALLEEGPVLRGEQLPFVHGRDEDMGDVIRRIESAITQTIPPEGLDFEALVEELERSLIQKAYRAAEGNQSRTAKLLRLNRDKLRYRMKNFELL